MESIKTFIPKVLISDEAKGLQSVFKDTIQLEFDRQRLDELNMLYVTCTRATDQLYLLLSKKEENEKMWLNIKSIDWEPTRLITQSDDKLSIGQIESKASNMPIEVQKLAPNLLIDQYIYQPWNNRIRLKREQNAVNGIAELRDKGVQLHALLNNFEQNKSIKKLIEQSIAANEMAAENALEFQTILLELSTNKQYNFLFETSATHKTEKELITANGQAMRPDKVIIYADHCLVVDYKYANYQEISEREKQKHQQQVQGYMEQIQLIENKSCKGYLLYLHPRIDLVEVKY
jgi:ATP-dependent exoDNAse (exonuclease V) beta subunit